MSHSCLTYDAVTTMLLGKESISQGNQYRHNSGVA